MAHLGEKLRDFRIAKGMTQLQMANFLAISYRTYQEIEKSGEVKKSEVLKIISVRTKIDTQENASDDNRDPDIKEKYIKLLEETVADLKQKLEATKEPLPLKKVNSAE